MDHQLRYTAVVPSELSYYTQLQLEQQQATTTRVPVLATSVSTLSRSVFAHLLIPSYSRNSLQPREFYFNLRSAQFGLLLLYSSTYFTYSLLLGH